MNAAVQMKSEHCSGEESVTQALIMFDPIKTEVEDIDYETEEHLQSTDKIVVCWTNEIAMNEAISEIKKSPDDKKNLATESLSSTPTGRGRGRGRARTQTRRLSPTPKQDDESVGSTSDAAAPRGRGGRRGSRRGGRAGGGGGAVQARGAAARTRPVANDEHCLLDIVQLPTGQPLERPLHPKRRRKWSPTSSDTSRGSTAVAVPEIPQLLTPQYSRHYKRPISPALHLECGPSSSSATTSSLLHHPAFGSSARPPSPALQLECGPSSSSASTSSLLHQPALGSLTAPPSSAFYPSTGVHTPGGQGRGQPESHTEAAVTWLENYGSEAESDGDVDEELVPVLVPRRVRLDLDTPLDEDNITALSSAPKELSASLPIIAAGEVLPSETELPRDMYDFVWTTFPDSPIQPESRREAFSESNVGPTTPCADPYETFTSIWDRQFMEYIALETNRYAQKMTEQLFANNALHPRSRMCDWCDTTADELYVLFAILLLMGMIVKGRVEDYWSNTSDAFSTPGFSKHMSLKRFQMLTRCLHFNNNEDMRGLQLGASEAKLFKIKPVLSHLCRRFEAMYNLQQNISIDESLLQWKGWLEIKQFIPNKTASTGIKSYELCESQTGYLWRFEIHAHKASSTRLSGPITASTPALVLRLLQGLENKGHTLWMDNYYNSPALARKLKTLGFDCVGTLRTNREHVPESLSTLTKANMRVGQITGFTSGDVDVMVWRDTNRVATISTYHGNAITLDGRKPKPILIQDYNIMMGGVDKKDQMLAAYPVERKRTKIWYKKLFRRLLNVSVLNSYVLVCKSTTTKIPHRSFRTRLINSLLEKHKSFSAGPSPLRPSRTGLFEAKHHYPLENPLMHNKANARQRRRCCLCHKRTRFHCAGCEKSVCISPCFPLIHK